MSDATSTAPHERASLFDRPLPEGYREELGALLAEVPLPAPRGAGSLLLFRLGGLRLALETHAAAAIAPVLHIARVPHRSGTVLLGLIAFRGEILPCCALERLLDLEEHTATRAQTLILEEAPGRYWAVPVDAMLGVRVVEEQELQPIDAPIDERWIARSFVDGDGPCFVLDHNLLFRQINLATA